MTLRFLLITVKRCLSFLKMSRLIPYEIQTTPGTTKVRTLAAVKYTLLSVHREGMQYDIIWEGTPTGRQVKVHTRSANLEFANPFNDNEKINILVKTRI